MTDELGNVAQVLDYYPFGGIRLNDKASSFDEQRKFTGHEYDTDTNLHYAGQRYYNQDIGRFVSEDAVFLAMGTSDKRTQILLQNPQAANSYSYTANNPLRYTDPEGEIFDTILDIGFVLYDVYKVSSAAARGDWAEVRSEAINLGLDAAGA